MILNFSNDSLKPKNRKSIKVLAFAGLVGALALGSTFAANINLNGDSNVEFGQGVVTTTACDDDGITVTPFSTFINAPGVATHKLTSIKLSGIDTREGKCAGKTFVIKAYGDGGVLQLVNYSNSFTQEDQDYDYVEIAALSGEFTWISGGTDGDDVVDVETFPEVALTETSFTISFTSAGTITRTPLADAEAVKRITIETKDTTCEQGFGCEIGDVGPGGGIVFLTPTSLGNNTNAYFEISPENAVGTFSLCTETNVNLNTGIEIGDGISNTELLNGEGRCNTSSNAVYAANQYSSNGYSDWFLPSYNELIAAKNNARAKLNNWSELYLSSSGYATNGVWWIDFDDSRSCGSDVWPACTTYKGQSGYPVRPVRIFVGLS